MGETSDTHGVNLAGPPPGRPSGRCHTGPVTDVLTADAWRARQAAHEARVDGWLGPHLARRRAGIRHPVEDFLFTYYSYRPAQLRRWRPGAGVTVVDPPDLGPYHVDGRVDVEAVRRRRGDSIRWTAELLRRTAARTPHLGCFGLHEWAMVYRERPDEVRHNAWPLRLPPDGIAAVVEERGVRCSHFDAYRFFTDRPGRSTCSAPPATRRPTTSSRAACTPTWTCTSGRTNSTPWPAPNWSPTASRWPATSGYSTCGPARTTWPASATRRYASRRRGAGRVRRRAARVRRTGRPAARPAHRADGRMLTARATTSATVTSDTADSDSIVNFAQRDNGSVSVGLNAVALVNDR